MRRGVVGLLLAWTLVQGLREPWRALQYHLADPWPAEAPVLWTPDSGHVQQLAATVGELPLGDFGVIAVSTDPALADQGWYQYLWLAYLLPRHHLIWAPGEDTTIPPTAQARLVLRGGEASIRPVPSPGSAQKPGPGPP